MNFALSEEQVEIRATAQRLLAEVSKHDRVVELSESESGWDREEWRQIAELGWTGMHIPEERGGVGLGYVELILLMEQMGANLYCSPFFSTVCLAANALLTADDRAHDELLAAIAAGERTATLALTEPGGGWGANSVQMTARQDDGGWVLSGSKSYVIDGHTAETILVVARIDGADEAGLGLFAVSGDTEGLTRTPVRALDETRKLAALEFDGVKVATDAVIGEPGSAWPVVERTLQLASVALAAEMLGGAQHCFDASVAYSLDRFQFGRPIGSFQAIKHKCADLLMLVEQSRSTAYYAGWVAANAPDQLPVLAPLAKAHIGDAYWQVVKDNIQIHGGIGFTWEHEAHLYYRRASASQTLFGDSDAQRAQMLQALGV